MKKIIVILLIAILFFSMSIMPVYAVSTLEMYAQDLIQIDGQLCTIQYYAPAGNYQRVVILASYPNSWTSTPNAYYLVFYSESTQWTYSDYNCWLATEAFYYSTFSTYEEAITALFTNESATEYTIATEFSYTISGVAYTHKIGNYPDVYMYQDNVFSDEAAASLEAAYYDWYVETNGEEPTFIQQTPDDEIENNSSGIIAVLEDILEAITPNIMPGFMGYIAPALEDRLADNNFYSQVNLIKDKLTELFNQNYRDPRKFKEINPLKITLGRPVKANADGTGYTYSGIDYGLNDVSLVGDMRWFFGTHYDTGDEHDFINVDGSYAVKYYTDAIISAFLWLAFGWYMWHNLPDLISGEIGIVSNITNGIASNSNSGTTTITTTTDMTTGETKTIKTTKKRG